ncbi:hypothetical protein BDW02DRAFT_496646, partial [Decorospora gaudefroyi]
PEEQAHNPSVQECTVCASEHPIEDYPSLASCTHTPTVCHSCFLQWLHQSMENTTWSSIVCPASTCTNPITHNDVQKYAPAATFTRFDELSIRSYLSADTNFLYCLAAGCTSGQIHDTGVEGPIFRCVACGFRMCTAHEPVVAFHEGEACTQYTERVERERVERLTAKEEEARKRRQDDEASVAEVGRSSVECPGCGAFIQKTTGCDHMTCRRTGCGFEFCYVCRAPYGGVEGIRRAGNSAHAKTCRYHSAKLPRYRGPILG